MTVPEYIYAESINAGLTKAGACGLLGNIQEESNFQTNNLEDRANTVLGLSDDEYTKMVDSGQWKDFITDHGVHGGYGLVQTTLASRKRQFLDFMRSRKKSISDLDGQMSFILWEMKNMFPSVWRVVTTSDDLYACTQIIMRVYENPEEQVENLKRRYSNAKKWYAQLKDKEVLRNMTQTEAINHVLNIAKSEVGYREKASNTQLDDKFGAAGSGNWTKYARDLDALGNFYNGAKNGYAWCDVFIDWLFVKAFGEELGRQMICQPLQSAGAGCLYSAQYYKNDGRWVTSPQAGDQIFFSYAAGEYSHTGIVESVSGGKIVTIEGNSSDQVARRSYSIGNAGIVGYGRPKWELVSNKDAVEPDDIVSNVQDIVSNTQQILRKGSIGDGVYAMQEKLQRLGYDLGSWGVDGDFGNATYKAVLQFQKDHGLLEDGEAGPQTLAAIEAAIGNVSVNVSVQTAHSSAAANVQASQNGTPQFKVGDTVMFTGNGHYFSASSKVGFSCKPGRAIVRAVNKSNKALHPYRVQAIRGSGSTVNGWVNADAIKKE